jgi:hypothetical protein
MLDARNDLSGESKTASIGEHQEANHFALIVRTDHALAN